MDIPFEIGNGNAGPIQQWAALVRPWAYRPGIESDRRQMEKVHDELTRLTNRVLSERRTGMQVNERDIAAWLAGRDAPQMDAHGNMQLHEAFLMALGLRYFERKNGKASVYRYEVNGDEPKPATMVDGLIHKKIAARKTIEEAYEEAGLEASTRPITAEVVSEGAHGNMILARRGGSEHERERIEDSKHLKKLGRVHYGNGYEHLRDSELRSILDSTPNVFEFLRSYRCWAYGKETNEGIAAITGINSHTFTAYETGKNLPARERLPGLLRLFTLNPNSEADEAKFLELYIRARDALVRGHIKVGDSPNSITQSLQDLPTTYWRSALDRALDEDAWQLQEDKPNWSDCVHAFTCRGQYLRAIRCLFDVSYDQLVPDIRCGVDALHDIETGSRRPHSIARGKLIEFYADLQRQVDEGATEVMIGGKPVPVPPEARERPFFDRAVLTRLDPAHRLTTHVEDVEIPVAQGSALGA